MTAISGRGRGVAAKEHVVIIGAGIGGLGTALALGRAGHPVTLLERDALPATGDVEAAFAAERRGAQQVHQTHGFLARVVVLLRDRFPDVLDKLLAAGCATMPANANLGEPRPGDEDLSVLIVRRTTFEWILGAAVLAEANVTFRAEAAVTGLVAPAGVGGGPLTVTGVRLADGSTVAGDVVVDASGRRSAMPGWLAALGVTVPEAVHESGLMYLSRWYRLPAELDVEVDPKLGGDLRFVKYLAVPGDARSLSITIAVPTADTELRAALSDPDGFERACTLLPGPDRFFDHGPLEPLGGVRPMAGLLNRLRRFVDDQRRPTVLGFHAVGDSHTCTNPLYGRGCSLALVQALLLADATAAHPGDPSGRSLAYEKACHREIEPWFHSSVQMDAGGADPGRSGSDAPPNPMARVFAAAATDPVIGRGLTRMMNLLTLPSELAADPEFGARVAAIFADPESYPLPPRIGPTRAELLDGVGAVA
jgi:2-polyprenyl-6-methoxyphenol hydroxylase-like FAD-dependent oxidoreductase